VYHISLPCLLHVVFCTLLTCHLRGVFYTGGAVNPARAFGPDAVNMSFTEYHWIYWAGPVLGSLMATGFYLLVKALEYETVNPEQDHDGASQFKFDPEKGVEVRLGRDFDVKTIDSDTISIVKT
jgi:hypothetical protein